MPAALLLLAAALAGAAALDGADAASCDDGVLFGAAKRVLVDHWDAAGSYTRVSAQPGFNHVDSTTSLLAAQARAHWSASKARAELKTVLGSQLPSGLVPRFAWVDPDPAAAWMPHNDTFFPGPAFWGGADPPLAALPMHAFTAWRLFELSSASDSDVLFLADVWPQLYAWHDFLFSSRWTDDDGGGVLITHPWEAALPGDTPLWGGGALDATRAAAAAAGWTAPADIPASVFAATGFPGNETYSLELFLASECGNCTLFGVRDVLFNAMLLRSTLDLQQIATQLADNSVTPAADVPTDAQLSQLGKWAAAQATAVSALFDDGVRIYESAPDCACATAQAFSPLLAQELGAERLDDVVFHLLSESEPATFACGELPVPAVQCGGCAWQPDAAAWASVLDNYVAARGLYHNGADVTGDFVRNGTLNLACNTTFADPARESPWVDVRFSLAYDADSGAPLPVNGWGAADGSSLAAAAVVELLLPDNHAPPPTPPPISHTLTFVMMVLELAFAFFVGGSCVVISFKFIRQYKQEAAASVGGGVSVEEGGGGGGGSSSGGFKTATSGTSFGTMDSATEYSRLPPAGADLGSVVDDSSSSSSDEELQGGYTTGIGKVLSYFRPW